MNEELIKYLDEGFNNVDEEFKNTKIKITNSGLVFERIKIDVKETKNIANKLLNRIDKFFKS